MFRAFLLLVILFIPGEMFHIDHGMLVKAFVIAAGACCLLSQPNAYEGVFQPACLLSQPNAFEDLPRPARILLNLGLVILFIAFLSSWTSPVVPTWYLWFVGSPERVEGWGVMASVLAFSVAWWPGVDHELQAVRLGWVYAAAVGIVIVFFAISGWGGNLGACIGGASKLATGCLFALACPYLMVFAFLGGARRLWIATGVLLIALWLLPSTGCRCAILGVIVGIAVVAGLSAAHGPSWERCACAIVGFAILVFWSPSLAGRIHTIQFTGPRAQMAVQAWDHGLYPLGWGIESQSFLIDDWNIRGGDVGRYDRFHFWPVDVAVTVGWVGLIVVVWSVGCVFVLAVRNRDLWHVRGLAGSFAAFLTYATWNPPPAHFWVLAGVSAFGIAMAEGRDA